MGKGEVCSYTPVESSSTFICRTDTRLETVSSQTLQLPGEDIKKLRLATKVSLTKEGEICGRAPAVADARMAANHMMIDHVNHECTKVV